MLLICWCSVHDSFSVSFSSIRMQCLESSSMISPAPMVREAVGARSLLTDERRDNPKSFLPSQRYPQSRSVRSAVTEGCSRSCFSCMALGYIFFFTCLHLLSMYGTWLHLSLVCIAVYVWHMVTYLIFVLALLSMYGTRLLFQCVFSQFMYGTWLRHNLFQAWLPG